MPRLIASLTSFPGRIGTVHRAIDTILSQSALPDRIVLYLADEQFPGHVLPDTLSGMIADNPRLEVRWWPRDIKSFKKLVPALIEFPDDIIITFDDDILYPANIIDKLLKKHREYPAAVCGCRVRQIAVKGGQVGKYSQWHRLRSLRQLVWGKRPAFRNVSTTGGGALFPPHVLHPDAVREDLFMSLCPTTDDLWFWAMAVHNGMKTVPAGGYLSIDLIEGSQTETLAKNNVWGENLNDKSMERILTSYPDIAASIRHRPVTTVDLEKGSTL